MAMFHLLKIRTSIDVFKNERCKVTFGLEYISLFVGLRARDLSTFYDWPPISNISRNKLLPARIYVFLIILLLNQMYTVFLS